MNMSIKLDTYAIEPLTVVRNLHVVRNSAPATHSTTPLHATNNVQTK